MRSSSLGTAMFALVAIGSVARAQSQSQIDSLRLRNDCRLAQQVIETGDPAAKTEWAYGIIHLCLQAGGALASAWSMALAAGAQPIGDADRAAALTALDRIVSAEPESDIGIASRFLVRELRRPTQ